MDQKSNAALQTIMDDAQEVRSKEQDIRNSALEDAAIVADIFAEANERAAGKEQKDSERRIELGCRAELAHRIASTIRARKNFK